LQAVPHPQLFPPPPLPQQSQHDQAPGQSEPQAQHSVQQFCPWPHGQLKLLYTRRQNEPHSPAPLQLLVHSGEGPQGPLPKP
jgi:hypothetical protein